MSYILQALKKTEAENDPDVRASLAIDRNTQQRQRIIQGFVIAALVINAGVLLWLFYPNEAPISAPPVIVATVREPAPIALAASAAPASSAARASVTLPATPAPGVVEDASSTFTPLLELDALPAAVRNRFPPLDFSTHVYADDPSLRAVVVNGQRLTQGEAMGELQLSEITEDGVIVRFESYLIGISVLDSWNN
jgi:hypothetical protein